VLRNIVFFLLDLFVMLFALFYFFRTPMQCSPFSAGSAIRGIHAGANAGRGRDLIFASVTTSLSSPPFRE